MQRTWYTGYPDNRVVVDGVDLSEKYRMVLIDGYTLSPPATKTYTVDIPGGNGLIDLTDVIIGDSVYENREHSFTFYILDQLDQTDFETAKTEISNFLHGKAFDYTVTWDPDYTYHGRFEITGYEHELMNTGILGSIEITVDCEPYKSKGTQTFSLDAVGGKDFVFTSGRRRVNPTIECAEPCTVAFGDDDEVSLSAGTWKLNTIVFEEGANTVYINSRKIERLRWDDCAEGCEYALLWETPTVTESEMLYSVTVADNPWPPKSDSGSWLTDIPTTYVEEENDDGVLTGMYELDMDAISDILTDADIQSSGGFILWTRQHDTYSNSVGTSSYSSVLYVPDGDDGYVEIADDPSASDPEADGVVIDGTFYYTSSDRTLANEDADIDAYDIPTVRGSDGYYDLDEDSVLEYDLVAGWWNEKPSTWSDKGVYGWTRVTRYYTDGVWTRCYQVESNYVTQSSRVHYVADTQGTDTPDTTAWSTTDPRTVYNSTDGYSYVWTRTTIVDSSGSTFYSYDVDYLDAVDGDPLTWEEYHSYLMCQWEYYKDNPEAALELMMSLVVLEGSDDAEIIDDADDEIQVYVTTDSSANWQEYDPTKSEDLEDGEEGEQYDFSYVILDWHTVDYSDGLETYQMTASVIFVDDDADVWSVTGTAVTYLGYDEGDSATDISDLMDADWVDSIDDVDTDRTTYTWTKIVTTYTSSETGDSYDVLTFLGSERNDYDEIMASIRLSSTEYKYQVSSSGTEWTTIDECAYSWVITRYSYVDYPDISTYSMVVTYNATTQAADSYRWDTVHGIYGDETLADFSTWEDASGYSWNELESLGYTWTGSSQEPDVVTYFQYEWEDL